MQSKQSKSLVQGFFLTLYCANAKKAMPYFIAYYKNNFSLVKALTFCPKNVILLVLMQ